MWLVSNSYDLYLHGSLKHTGTKFLPQLSPMPVPALTGVEGDGAFNIGLNFWRLECLLVPELVIRILPPKMLRGSIPLCPLISSSLPSPSSYKVCSVGMSFTGRAAAEAFLSNIGGSRRWFFRCSRQRECKGKKIKLGYAPSAAIRPFSVRPSDRMCTPCFPRLLCPGKWHTHCVGFFCLPLFPDPNFHQIKQCDSLFQSSIWSGATDVEAWVLEGGPLEMSVKN